MQTKLLLALFATLCLFTMVRAEEVTLSLTVTPQGVAAGGQIHVWLNALNASSNTISWIFPQAIESKITTSQGTLAGLLDLQSAETNTVVIAPGTFARREYSLVVPNGIAGQIVLETPRLGVNGAVLNVQAPGGNADASAKTNALFFLRFINAAGPNAPGKGSEPDQFFKEHISGYEPMYIILGAKSPNAKFQVSFAYQLLNNDGALAADYPALKGFHLGYTQTSLWDWHKASAPFYDTSYRPELFYAWKNVTRAQPNDWVQLDLQGGLKHESNGKAGADSRTMDTAYVRPTLTLGRDDGFQFAVQPGGWAYIGSVSGNSDIADYRGYADLRTVVGWKRGFQLSAMGRMGEDGNHSSEQFDLTYPTMRLCGDFSLFLDVQYFTGYGESLLGYNQRSDELRVGFALFR